MLRLSLFAFLAALVLSGCTATFVPYGEVRAGVDVTSRPQPARQTAPQVVSVQPVFRASRPDRMDVSHGRSLNYRCNKGKLDVKYLNDFSVVEVRHDGRWHRLTYSGSQYSNNTYTWQVRAHGKNATLLKNGRTILQGCNT
jgi:membrane-bound inhibitor of C-type lysozyme